MIKTSTGENMSKYSDLLQVIKSRVCQNNNFPQTLLADSHSYRARQVWYRIGQIFTLECILDEYRKHFSSDYYYLDNDKALHHLIFEMTKWKPEEIRRLSLNDCLFIIASQLKPSYMSEDAAAVLASLNLPTGHYPVEDFPQEDWDPRKTQYSLKAISSDSPNLRRDLTQPLLKSGFFCYQTVEVGKIDFLLPKPVFKLLSGHARVKKIWLLHSFPQISYAL